MTKGDYLSELPPDLADVVRAFRAEMSAAREQEAARLREVLEHFKREMEIETARFKREAEIETAVLRRLTEIFKGAWPSDNMTAHVTP
jgi:hypothetical protein